MPPFPYSRCLIAASGVCRHLRLFNLNRGVNLLAVLTALSLPAQAQQWTGVTSPDWSTPSNWNTGLAPDGGTSVQIDTDATNQAIASGVTFTTNQSVNVGSGAGSHGTLVIRDGSSFDISSLTVGAQGTGTVTVEDATVLARVFVWLGDNSGGTGTLNIAGPNARFNAPSYFIDVGNHGTGSLNITNGAQVRTNVGYVGDNPGSNGFVTISGAGSLWEAPRFFGLGGDGNATVLIENGGRMITAGEAGLAYTATSNSLMTVTGSGSQFGAGEFAVGVFGQGALRVDDGGLVTAGSVYLGYGSNTSGTMTVAGTPGARGVVSAGQVIKGNGNAAVLLDGGVLQARGNQSDFLSNFSAGDITAGAGGAWFDSNGFDIGITAPLSGPGGLHKIGTGRLTLASNSAGLLGQSSVQAGTLNVTGVLGGDLVLASFAQLTGNGAVGNLVAGANAIIAPGPGVATLTVNGDLTLDSGSTFAVDVSGAGIADRVAVTGTAQVAGVVSVTGVDTQNSYHSGARYRIVDAALVDGGFSAAQSQSGFLQFSIDQQNDAVDLVVDIVGGNPGGTPGTPPAVFVTAADTANNRATAGAVDEFAQSGDALVVYNTLLSLSHDEARDALDQISGEIHASDQLLTAENFELFADTLIRRTHSRLASNRSFEPLAYATSVTNAGVVAIEGVAGDAPAVVQNNVWLSPRAAKGSSSADGNVAAAEWDAAGLAGGYEVETTLWGGWAQAGFGLGLNSGTVSVPARRSVATNQSGTLGVYGSWTDGNWHLGGALAYAGGETETSRRMLFGGLDRTASASYRTQAVGGSLEAHYDYALTDDLGIAPIGTLDFGWSRHGGATETGAGALNATIAEESRFRADIGLGLGLDYALPLASDHEMTLTARAIWQHSLGELASQQSLSLAGGGSGFDVAGSNVSRDQLVLGAGLSFAAQDNLALSLGYDGDFSAVDQSHSVQGSLKLQF